ncbi:hypothetical protein EVAR_37642_1 [Eumeta japonica]|uniref:Uncharacterized protein n=1 Tax=Eumeta variegata TaxID=151549 RepID=A0A4C1VNK3_EUMVA|nr:hypothetical protein EVAR_37642_1 [Eumeta japonica]
MEIDENGVLRLKGIKAAKDVSFTLNRPAVLSGDSSIAKLIMKHYHERLHDIGFASIHRSKRNSESDVFGQRHEFRRRKQRTDEHTRGTREDEERSRRPHHNLKFIPPALRTWVAPAFGAICQNRVGRYIERGALEEVLHTLLLEAEHIVNSRPLTEVDIEPAEAEGPNHFLIGRSAALPQRATLTTTCSSACKLAHVSAPRRSLLAEVVERILTDSGACRRAATLYAARRPRATSC